MKIEFKILYLKKRFPLRISRGVRDGQHNLFVSVNDGKYVGWGETSPGVSEGAETAEEAQGHLEQFLKTSHDFSAPQIVYDLWCHGSWNCPMCLGSAGHGTLGPKG